MPVIEIKDIKQKEVEVFHNLTDHQLRNKLHPTDGIMVVESPKVIKTALDSGCVPISMLCEKKHITGDAAGIISACGDIPIYTGEREVLQKLTGYKLTRGVLCAMRRPQMPAVGDICRASKRIVIISGVCDTTNIGAIFRSAAALGMDGILLTRDSCDPFNRRSIRVSMGSVFLMPWTWIDDIGIVHRFGFKTLAMALRHDSIALDDPKLKDEDKLAIIMGTEGDGLPMGTIDDADYVVKIPMAHGVDSLNVAAASAVAFWELGKTKAG